MSSYQGNRKITRKSSRKSSKRRSSRKSSKKSSKRRSSRKNYKNINQMVESVISDINESKPRKTKQNKDMPQMVNGLYNPMNIDYDPLHVQYMVPQTNMEHLKKYTLNAQQMTQGSQMNGLSQMFQGMPQMQQPMMQMPQMQQPMMQMQPEMEQMQQPMMQMPQMQPEMEQMQQPMMQMGGAPVLADFSRLNISLAHM
jgi:hypothetical protein